MTSASTMTVDRAREIAYGVTAYLDLHKEDRSNLDGWFTAEQLEAIAFLMRFDAEVPE